MIRGITDKDGNPKELLPNGHLRKDYYDLGYSDEDIEFWGVDKPEAPDPFTAGFEILDFVDGDYANDAGYKPEECDCGLREYAIEVIRDYTRRVITASLCLFQNEV